MKELYLLRGLPGSGKTTLAKSIGGPHFEADQYFLTGPNNVYTFDASKLKNAHELCISNTTMAILNEEPRVIVSNTFTQEWEMKAYYELAESHGYTVYSLIVENRHEGENIHGVPVEALDRMENRFEVKLR
jgi:predicted kinase